MVKIKYDHLENCENSLRCCCYNGEDTVYTMFDVMKLWFVIWKMGACDLKFFFLSPKEWSLNYILSKAEKDQTHRGRESSHTRGHKILSFLSGVVVQSAKYTEN